MSGRTSLHPRWRLGRGAAYLGTAAVAGLALLLLLLPSATLAATSPPALAPASTNLAVPSPGALPSSDRVTSPTIVAPTDGWLTFQGSPGHNGSTPDAVPPTDNVAWQTSLPTSPTGNTPVTAGLVTSGGLLYVASGDKSVYAYYETNGTLKWQTATAGAFAATPSLDQGLLLLGAEDGDIYELNATTGALVHTLDPHFDAVSSSVVPWGADLLTPCAPKNLCEWPVAGGSPVWNVTVGAMSGTPSVDASTGMVLVGNTTGSLRELYLSNGSYAWNYTFVSGPSDPLQGALSLDATPALVDVAGRGPVVVVAVSTESTTSGAVAAFNESQPKSGARPIYIDDLAAGFTASSFAASPSQFEIATSDGTVLAYHTLSGTPVVGWTDDPWPGNSNAVSSSLVAATTTLVVGFPGIDLGGGELLELSNATGKEVANLDAVGVQYPILATPAVDSSGVYVADDGGDLYAIGTAVPTAPQDFASVRGNNSLELSWHAPASTGGEALIQYVLHYGPTGGTLSGSLPVIPSATSADLTALSNGQEYEVSLDAQNALGTSPVVYLNATPGAVPYPPTGLVVAPTYGGFDLSWQPPNPAVPGSDGGFAVSGYLVRFWNATAGVSSAQTVSVGDLTSYTATGLRDGTTYDVEVAAENSVGTGNDTGVVTVMPHLAWGVFDIEVEPSSIWAHVTLHFNGSLLAVTASNGTARVAVLPGTYWVNATASGYLPYDEQFRVTSGQQELVYVNLSAPPRSEFPLSTLEIGGLIAVIALALILGVWFGALRYRRLAEIASPDDVEEPVPGEGISEDRAREILQPSAPAPELGSGGGAAAAFEIEEPTPTGAAPSSEEEEPEEAEGASGRLGEYFQRRRADKETLKSSEEDAPGSSDGPSG